MVATIDLHMHSSYSCDGDILPEILVSIAKRAGINTIAVTDHNTTAGVSEAIKAGKALSIEVIPAVELDCIFGGVVFHLLGYYIDFTSEKYRQVDENIRLQEMKAAETRIELVRKIGIDVDKDEVLAHAKDGFVTGEVIAEVVLSKPESADNPILRPYFPGGARSDNPYVNFYWDFCSQGKPAYVHIEYISMGNAIKLIKETGGVPVLAHPGNNLKGRLEMLGGIVREGIEGIEACSSYHTPEQCRYFSDKAKEYSLLITGGSDFHGKTKPAIRMGEFGLNADGTDIISSLRKAAKHSG